MLAGRQKTPEMNAGFRMVCWLILSGTYGHVITPWSLFTEWHCVLGTAELPHRIWGRERKLVSR